MKKSLTPIIAFFICISIFPQESKVFYTVEEGGSGYVNTTEVNYGLGMGNTENPFSKYFIGLTNISAYQMDFKRDFMENKILQFGGGTGYYCYNEGAAIPLFVDFRFILKANMLAPYFYMQGGDLINIKEFGSKMRMFGNGGAGIHYPITKKIAINLGLGFMVQAGANLPQESFINFKLGFSFLPGKQHHNI